MKASGIFQSKLKDLEIETNWQNSSFFHLFVLLFTHSLDSLMPTHTGEGICFTQSTGSNTNLIQKQSHRHPEIFFNQMFGHPVAWSSWHITLIIMTQLGTNQEEVKMIRNWKKSTTRIRSVLHVCSRFRDPGLTHSPELKQGSYSSYYCTDAGHPQPPENLAALPWWSKLTNELPTSEHRHWPVRAGHSLLPYLHEIT
jgi:hypothetical protein